MKQMKLKEWIRHNKEPLIWYASTTLINSVLSGWLGWLEIWIVNQVLVSITFFVHVKLIQPILSLLLCGSILVLPYQARAQEKGGSGGGAIIPVTFAINGIIYPTDVRRSARAVCSIVAASGKEATMTWAQLVAEAQSYGVKVTGVGDGSSYYARDGQPISEEESHIHYDALTGKVSVYSDPSKVHRIIVKRSRDLIYWEDFMHLEMEENRNFQILDTTVNGQMFYSMQLIDGD